MTEAEIKERRAMYVKAWMQGIKNKSTEVKRLSMKLFVSEATIWRDLRK